MEKINVLNGLRGFAALFVVFAHFPIPETTFIGHLLVELRTAFSFGYFGVDLFFVLSGFLITRILLDEKRNNKLSFKRFYLKRVLRIFPIYYITVLLCGILWNWDGIGYTATYISNYYFSFHTDPHALRHTWSLAVEEQYYIVWPALIYFFTIPRSKLFIVIGIPIIVLFSSYLICKSFDYSTANALIYRGIQSRILSLGVGSLFAYYEGSIRKIQRREVILLLAVFCLSVLYASIIESFQLLPVIPIALQYLVTYTVASASFFLLVLQLENSHGLLNSLFTNKIMLYVGTVSYGIYLYHLPILYYFGVSHMDMAKAEINLWLPTALIVAIPIISYHSIERPLLMLKSKLR